MASHEPATVPHVLIGPDDHDRMVSADTYADAEFIYPWKYERVDGRLIVMSPEGEEHGDASDDWRDRLILYKLRDRPGVVQKIKSSGWIRVDEGTDRHPDIAVYLVKDSPVPKIPERIPDIVFEFVSPGRVSRDRDYIDKRADYHKLGVPEYVIVDRFESKVTVMIHSPEGYLDRILTSDDIYTTSKLPGFAVELSEVLPS